MVELPKSYFFTINITKIIIIIVWVKEIQFSSEVQGWKDNLKNMSDTYLFSDKHEVLRHALIMAMFWNFDPLLETQVWTDVEEHIRLHPRWLLSLAIYSENFSFNCP